MTSIGENIRKIRVSKSYSQDYMAEKLNITQQAYSRIEANAEETHLSRLVQIAEVLEVALFQLLEPQMSKDGKLLTEGERVFYHEIIANQQRLIQKQEEIISSISAVLVSLQTNPALYR